MPPNNEMVKITDGLAPLARPPLLLTESADEYAALVAALRQGIKRRGVIAQIYLEDMAAIIWEIQRLRRCKTATVNNAFRPALQSLLYKVLHTQGTIETLVDRRERVELADGWFDSQEGREEILAILKRFGLDETAIEAEAIRLTWSDLEMIERMQASLRLRLDKTLGCIAEYGEELGDQAREVSNRILTNDDATAFAADEAA
jgi:hypothetical protein